MKPIVLASSSSRRKELLEKIGLKFQTIATDYDEDMSLPMAPLELAIHLSGGKARKAAEVFKNHIVIAADTFVLLDNLIMGKPHSSEEAQNMLEKISDKMITVITGYTIIDTGENKIKSNSVATKVYIKHLTKHEILAYVRSGEPLDKAGAFAIQGLGSLIVTKIEGDFYNVMGLPIFDLAQSMKEFGIHILS